MARQKNKKGDLPDILFLIWAIVFTIGSYWILTFKPENPKHGEFWIVALLGIGLFSVLFVLPRRLHLVKFILSMTSLFVPPFLSSRFETFRYIGSAPIVYIWFGATMALYLQYKGIKEFDVPLFRKKPDSRYFRLPQYLPLAFVSKPRIHQNRKKNLFLTEITYDRKDSEYIIWIKESNYYVPGFAHRKWTDQQERQIQGILVHIAVQSQEKGEPPVVDIKWNDTGINYVLRSDGVSVVEAEKVVASLITQTLDT